MCLGSENALGGSGLVCVLIAGGGWLWTDGVRHDPDLDY